MFPTVDVLQCVDVLLAGTLGDALITGCANGQLYVWSGTKVRRVVPAHRGMVSTMQVVGEEKMVTGSRDGTIKIWDRSLEIIRTFDMKTMATQSSVKPYGKNVFPPSFLERRLLLCRLSLVPCLFSLLCRLSLLSPVSSLLFSTLFSPCNER